MKKTATIVLSLLVAFSLQARTPVFTYGLEWGYTATLLKTGQYNFICAEGYRIIENPVTWRYFSNGSILANAGLNFTDHLNVSAYSGLLGVYSRRWMVPVELRVKYCPAGLDKDGFVLSAGGGVTFPTATLRETGARGVAGAGYRFAIFRKMSVDFTLSLNVTLDHDRITDPDTHQYVSRTEIESNTVQYYALNLSIGLNF
ncbi:MAG: hypothetical protein IJU68_04680 [Bacteroidales bacterium]|nr:hypothetical protein [Bacteroidales bacterium]